MTGSGSSRRSWRSFLGRSRASRKKGMNGKTYVCGIQNNNRDDRRVLLLAQSSNVLFNQNRNVLFEQNVDVVFTIVP
jgi:hypothetical protein